jgi:peptide/nickel transport system substrate-binding protein
VRHALPDKIVFTEGLTNEIIAQRLIADNGNDKYAVSDRSVPPSFQAQIAGNPKAKERATNPASPFVDYLVTNFGSKTMQNPKVREALAVSTDKGAYITAQGGPTMGTPATSMINPNTPGYKKYNAFGAPDNGDPAKAKQLLKEAGVSTPVKINYIYSGGTPTSDKAAAALKEGWEKAGFKVSLQPETQNYYTIIQNPAKQSTWDVAWGGWGQDWPGAATVIPPLWDSRVNLTKSSNAQDYGQYKSDKVNKAIDAAYKLTDPDKQNAAWGDIDEMIQKDGGYVPLSVEKFFLIHGSGVTNWIDNPAFADYPDLGSLGIQQ